MNKFFLILPVLIPFASLGYFGLRLIDFYMFSALISMFFYILITNSTFKLKTSVLLGVISFISLAIFSFLFIDNYEFGLTQFKYIEILLFLVLFSSFQYDEKDLIFFKKMVVVSMLIIVIGTIFRVIQTPNMTRYAGYFIYSNGVETSEISSGFNELAAYMGLCFTYLASGWIKKSNFFIGFILILIIFSIYMTKSRSAMLGVIVASSYLFVFQRHEGRFNLKFISISLLSISLFYIYSSGLVSFERYTSTFESGTFNNNTLLDRFIFWKLGFEAIFSNFLNFLFGFGVDGLLRVVGGSTTDSFYLDTLLRYGFFGSCILFLLYFLPLSCKIENSKVALHAIYIFVGFVSISGNVISDVPLGCFVFFVLYLYSRVIYNEE